MGAQLTKKVIGPGGAMGLPAGGTGEAYFFAGSPVKEVKRVYKGLPSGADATEGSESYVWRAEIVAPGYRIDGGQPVDKIEEDVQASVDAAAITVDSGISYAEETGLCPWCGGPVDHGESGF